MSEKLIITIETDEGPKTFHVDLSNPAHVDWLHQKLQICPIKSKLWNLEKRIKELEKPIRQQRILDLLKGQPRTQGWISRRTQDFCYPDLSDLLAENKIEHFMKGHSHLYKIKEEF